MLKLKYLFQNKALATMILENWEYDRDDKDLLEYFRISSNAIYWFKCGGELRILRFAPTEEKSYAAVLAELEYAHYLNKNGIQTVEPILSKSGKPLELISTPWGDYLASAFRLLPGTELDRLTLTDELIKKSGKLLGQTHRLSSSYEPVPGSQDGLPVVRSSWCQHLDWIETVLHSHGCTSAALEEHAIVKDRLSMLPTTRDTYGLIHFDFEADNLLYQEATETLSVIDLDDSMYSWYVHDIFISLDNFREELSEDRYMDLERLFLEGYREEYHVTEQALALRPLMKRFSNLYGYARVLHAIDERWPNEPEWMTQLRLKLDSLMEQRSQAFGIGI